eukprot:3147831-Ditylum_brightwellii.AAC.1
MSSDAKQSNTEAYQLAFTAKETCIKGSPSKDSLKKREKSSASKFAMRNLSIQKGSTQRTIESLTDSTSSSKNTSTKDWTINKFWFNAVGLLGCNNEIKTLHACWYRMMQPEQQTKEVVMISEYSGTGKTTLAFELKKKIQEGAFVTGKFD